MLPRLLQIIPRLLQNSPAVKAANTSECLLNEIRQMIYFLYLAKEITKILHSNIMNSVNVQCTNECYIYGF